MALDINGRSPNDPDYDPHNTVPDQGITLGWTPPPHNPGERAWAPYKPVASAGYIRPGADPNVFQPGSPNPPPVPPPPGGPGAPPSPPGGWNGSWGPLTTPFNQPFNAPPMLDLGGPNGLSYIPSVPRLTLPTYQTPAPFVPPTAEEAANDPGYRFAVGQGADRLENAAAARGVLNTGGTLRDLIDYGQQAGATQYNNVFARNLQTYGTNLQSQSLQPYQFAYQGALDTFAPQMTGYQTTAAAGSRQNELNYTDAWNQRLQAYNEYRNWQNDTFQKSFSTTTA